MLQGFLGTTKALGTRKAPEHIKKHFKITLSVQCVPQKMFPGLLYLLIQEKMAVKPKVRQGSCGWWARLEVSPQDHHSFSGTAENIGVIHAKSQKPSVFST